MAAHDYLEDLSSLLPAVTLLKKLGFAYLTLSGISCAAAELPNVCWKACSPDNCKKSIASIFSRARTIRSA